MNILYQEIPLPSVERYDDVLQSSDAFINSQGVVVFTVLILGMVMFGMMIIMFMMLRNQGKETKQQDKLITQHGLTIAQSQRQDGKIDALIAAVTKLVELRTADRSEKNTIMQTGIASIDENTKGVKTMTMEFEHLKTAIETMLETMSDGEIKLSAESQKAIIDGVASKLDNTMRECIRDAIQKITQEVPTVPAKLEATPKSKEEPTEKEETNE